MVMAIGLFSTCKEILKRKRRKKKINYWTDNIINENVIELDVKSEIISNLIKMKSTHSYLYRVPFLSLLWLLSMFWSLPLEFCEVPATKITHMIHHFLFWPVVIPKMTDSVTVPISIFSINGKIC